MATENIQLATDFRNKLRQHSAVFTNEFYLFVQMDNPEVRETRRQGFTRVIFSGQSRVTSITIYDGDRPVQYDIYSNEFSLSYHDSGHLSLFIVHIPDGLDCANLFFPGWHPDERFINLQ